MRKVEIASPHNSTSIDCRGYHGYPPAGKHLFQQQSKPQILFFIDGDDQHRIRWIQQFFRQQQATLHESKPLTVPIKIVGFDVESLLYFQSFAPVLYGGSM